MHEFYWAICEVWVFILAVAAIKVKDQSTWVAQLKNLCESYVMQTFLLA